MKPLYHPKAMYRKLNPLSREVFGKALIGNVMVWLPSVSYNPLRALSLTKPYLEKMWGHHDKTRLSM